MESFFELLGLTLDAAECVLSLASEKKTEEEQGPDGDDPEKSQSAGSRSEVASKREDIV